MRGGCGLCAGAVACVGAAWRRPAWLWFVVCVTVIWVAEFCVSVACLCACACPACPVLLWPWLAVTCRALPLDQIIGPGTFGFDD